MRENSATVPSRSLLLADAMRRHPAGSGLSDTGSLSSSKKLGCPKCAGTGWVRAVAVYAHALSAAEAAEVFALGDLTIACPACEVTR